MDKSLLDVSGIEGVRRMLAREPTVKVLMFGMHEKLIFASRAFQAGALGYVAKASAPEVLVAGDTVSAIAEKLQLNYKTVANHQSAIRQKRGVATSAQLVQLAQRHGVVA